MGGTSQLDVLITGGTPPYSFAWTPAAFVNNPTLQDPIAAPLQSTTYTVTVTDSTGLTAQASVVVGVGLGVSVNATPATIDPGETSRLEAIAQGGTGPFTYAWTPADSLDDASVADPHAMPASTTRYAVLVTDSLGATAIGLVTVTVNLRVSATADPGSIGPGGQSQLTATAEGGTTPYSYAWTPAASLDNPLAANPLASPTATTTYTVVVNDGAGAQSSAQAVVEVIPAAGVTACFTAEQTTFGPFTWNVQADGSCSTGSIQFYRWWADFNFQGQLPTIVTTSPIPPVFAYEDVGTFDIRLEADDGMGNTHAVIVPFTVVAEP